MLLECIQGEPIKIDKSPFIKDLRINFADSQRLRLKVKYIADGNNIPIDLVIYSYSLPKLNGCSISVTANGTEMESKSPFQLKLDYNFIKQKWLLGGMFRNKPINKEFNNASEIPGVLKELF